MKKGICAAALSCFLTQRRTRRRDAKSGEAMKMRQYLIFRPYFVFLCVSATLRLCVFHTSSLLVPLLIGHVSARAEVTAEQVNAAVSRGVAYLEKTQRPDGRWSEHESEPGGATALCALALMNCGRGPDTPSLKKALA